MPKGKRYACPACGSGFVEGLVDLTVRWNLNLNGPAENRLHVPLSVAEYDNSQRADCLSCIWHGTISELDVKEA